MTETVPAPAVARPPSTARRRGRRTLRLVAAVAFAFAVALSLPPLIRPELFGESLVVTTVVVGTWIPVAQEFAAYCLAVACGALVAARIVAAPPQDARVRLALANTGFGLAIPVVALIVFLSWFASDIFFILPETSPGGCRLVIRDHSFLNRGWDEVGLLQPETLVPTRTPNDTFWIGSSPYEDGSFALDWHGRNADLRVFGGSGVYAGPLECMR